VAIIGEDSAIGPPRSFSESDDQARVKLNAPGVVVVVVVGAGVVDVAVVVVVCAVVVEVVPLGATGSGPTGGAVTGVVVAKVVPVSVVLVAVVLVTVTAGPGASRTKKSPFAVPLPDATSSKACVSATGPLCGASQSFSLKLPAEHCRDGSWLWRQSRATTWHVEAKRTLPTTVVQPPFAESSHGLARAASTSGREMALGRVVAFVG
jgi:hypothetical protein